MAGYKDYHLNFRYPNGFTVELQINTRAMNDAKQGVGHALYEAMDAVEQIINSKESSAAQVRAAKKILAELSNASVAYYGSTGDQSNETASLSGIVEPLERISAIGAGLANSNLYPKLEPLLGNIRNNPDSASTNGLSSYSKNSLTNTGASGPSVSQGTEERSRPSIDLTIPSSILRDDMGEPPLDARNITANQTESNTSAPENIEKSEQIFTNGHAVGEETPIINGDTEDAARYEVWELDNILTSHDPLNGFAWSDGYPKPAQERPYHSDTAEQTKVRKNAAALNPRLAISDNPDAQEDLIYLMVNVIQTMKKRL